LPLSFSSIRLDVYRKVPKDLTQPTYTGAVGVVHYLLSSCCSSELKGFIATEVVNELCVDDPDKNSGGKIDLSLNIQFLPPHIHMESLGWWVLISRMRSGHHEVGHIDNPMKVRLNHGYGCRFEGEFTINKVPGNFYVSTHSATAQPQSPEMTHLIHKLAFGEKPLVSTVLKHVFSLSVPKHVFSLSVPPLQEYVAYSHTGRIIPAIWYQKRQPLYRFITTICAIIGGTFTVAGIIDSCIFTASEAWKKIQIGKMSRGRITTLSRGRITTLSRGRITTLSRGRITTLSRGRITTLSRGRITTLSRGRITTLSRGRITTLSRGRITTLSRGRITTPP
uniref:Endoplasmic reticulum-Golgi intermediate compartment protein n=1 Tax=Oncorhynchus mykiss TaxID=8022 RepID=A0A8K9UIN4_ONCMY